MIQTTEDIFVIYIQEIPTVMTLAGAIVALLSVRLVAMAIRASSSNGRDPAGVGGEIACALCAGGACMMAMLSGGVAVLSVGTLITTSLF